MTTRPDSGEIAALREYCDSAEPSAEMLADLRRRTLERIAASEAGQGAAAAGHLAPSPRRHRAGWRRRPIGGWALPAALATGTVAAVTAIAVGTMPTGTTPAGGRQGAAAPPVSTTIGAGSGSAASAPVLLRTVSSRAAAVQPLAVGSGRYVYTRTRSVVVTAESSLGAASVNGTATGATPAFVVSEILTEGWASASGLAPLRLRRTFNLNARPLTPADAAKLDGPASSILRPRTVEVAGPGAPASRPAEPGSEPGSGSGPAAGSAPDLAAPTPAFLASLPTDPARLLAFIRAQLPTAAGGKWSADQVAFDVAGSLLSTADAILPPAVRAALYRVLAALPGVRVAPGQTDLAGRSGTAVTRTEAGVRKEIIVDADTARVLGTREVATSATPSGPPAGTTLTWSTTGQRLVSRVGATS